jgi:hypothetical protein
MSVTALKLPLDQGPAAGGKSDAGDTLPFSPREQEAKKLDPFLKVCQMRFASVGADTQQVGELREPAKVCVLDARVETPVLAKRVATLLDDEWLVDELFGKPTVAILVTGGAQDFKMLPRVQRVFREGLVKAAQVRLGRRAGVDSRARPPCVFVRPPARATRSTHGVRVSSPARRRGSCAPRPAACR